MTGDRFQRPSRRAPGEPLRCPHGEPRSAAPRSFLRAALALSSLAALTLSAAAAAADPASSRPAASPSAPAPKKATPADRDAARALAEQAFEKLQAKKYDAAIDLFTRAEERFHAPTHLLYIAQAQRKRGRLLDAAATYRKVLAEALPRDAPQPFRDAQEQARAELAPLVARTPKVRVEVTGADPSKAVIEIGGRVVLAGASTPFDPGPVLVRVTPLGGSPLDRSVVLTESDAAEVVVRFDLPASIPLAIPIVALGLGAAAGGASIGVGLYSRDLRVAAADACRELITCPKEQLDKAETGRTLRDAAIVTGIAGGAVLVAGVTLLLVRPGPKSTVEPPEAEAPPETTAGSSAPRSPRALSSPPRPAPPAGPTIALRAGPSFVSLVGSF